MAKYDALTAELTSTSEDSRTFTFDELDAMIPGGLPASARSHRSWWGNAVDSNGQAAGWMRPGWKVTSIDLADERVTFERWPDMPSDALQMQQVRKGQLLRTLLDLLAEASGPISRTDAFRAIEKRVELTPYELTVVGKSQNPRWSDALIWSTAESVAAGWMVKTPDGWAITDGGRHALTEFPEDSALLGELNRLYRAHQAATRAATTYRTPAYKAAEAAIGVLDPGEWSSYSDIADVTGLSPQSVGAFINDVPLDGGHRVLLKDGRAGKDFRWAVPRNETQRDALEGEGLVFDVFGVADETKHVRAAELAAVLEESGVLSVPPRRAWLVRGSSVNGHDLIPTWREQGFVSLAASKLREVEAGISRDELKPIVNDDYSQTSYAGKGAKLDEFHAFLSRMHVDDVLVTTSQGRMYLGTVTGDAAYAPSGDGRTNLRRAAAWTPGDGIDYQDLPGEVAARLQVQYDVVEMTQQLDLLAPYLEASVESPSEPTPTREVVLPDASQELAEQLHVDRDWLQECIDLLRDRPQLIFYGPPGTGKTYIAQHLAEFLAGDHVRLVQFHPAYSYEDFFEGYRPDEKAGGFSLRPGPMRKIVDQAKDNPSTPYFLIIDEINRGNLAKIFGELYFLLEYRDQQVDLLYATDDDIGFTLPRNVFIIGTMNTADRSIALVDAAMRRRFAFLPLHPSEKPTKDVLRRWLAAEDLDRAVADHLDALNSLIEDDDFKVGPSYVMRKSIFSEGGLERAWRTTILPLLEEHHYGEMTRNEVASRYGWGAITARLTPTTDPDGPEDETDADSPQGE